MSGRPSSNRNYHADNEVVASVYVCFHLLLWYAWLSLLFCVVPQKRANPHVQHPARLRGKCAVIELLSVVRIVDFVFVYFAGRYLRLFKRSGYGYIEGWGVANVTTSVRGVLLRRGHILRFGNNLYRLVLTYQKDMEALKYEMDRWVRYSCVPYRSYRCDCLTTTHTIYCLCIHRNYDWQMSERETAHKQDSFTLCFFVSSCSSQTNVVHGSNRAEKLRTRTSMKLRSYLSSSGRHNR